MKRFNVCSVCLNPPDFRLCVFFFFEFMNLTDGNLNVFQVCDWPGEAGGAERSGSADPADSGTGEVAERDDGTEIQTVHGR